MRLILDGNNLGYRARASSMKLTKKDGTDVTTIYGVLKMLSSYLKSSNGGFKNTIAQEVKKAMKLDKEPVFEDVFVCWDGGKSKYRKEIYPDYKGHRERKRKERTEEEKLDYYNFLKQMDELHDTLPNFGVHSLKAKGWEADDLIYIPTEILSDDLTVIISTDRDLLQLVSGNTFVWSPGKDILYTEANFSEKVGVPFHQYLDYRVMVGDTSDNIDGIKGIGDKKAKTLLMKYGSLPNAMSDEANLRKSVVTARLFDNADIIVRNIKLMNLSKSNYVEDEIDMLIRDTINGVEAFNETMAKSYFMSKEFISLVADFENWASPFRKLNTKVELREEVNNDTE